MKHTIVFGLFAILLFGGSIYPAVGQTTSSINHIVINEVDTNPPGDDSKTISEWVELYNPTDSEVDLAGWTISSTTILKKSFTLPPGTFIQPGKFLAFSHASLWFTDVSELVQLRDNNGFLIDETPILTDMMNDFTSWQRIFDGFDTDSGTDWKFTTSSAGSSNGKLEIQDDLDAITVSIQSVKENYLFDQTAIISGAVSEQVTIVKPYFQQEQIHIKITGPGGYSKNIDLFPDLNLEYETSLDLRKVLGIFGGLYTVSVTYAGASNVVQFSVGEQIISIEEEEERVLEIFSDKTSYIPGQTAIINAKTSEVIPFEGLKFSVIDPNGKEIFDGTLYPNPSGDFSTTIFMTTVQPVYGFHKIISEYSTQRAETSFALVEDFKEDKLISLKTDKPAYGLGDTVIITGRLNPFWIFSLDFEILQTGHGSLGTDTPSILKIVDSVRLEGDSTFRYEFEIPNNSNRLGDYRVKVFKEVGEAITFFTVVPNPDEFVDVEEAPMTVLTDKDNYLLGDRVVIFGKINQLRTSTTFQIPTVDIKIKHLDGTAILSSIHKPTGDKPITIEYSLTAIPDLIGNYRVEDTLYKSVFNEGTYVITAIYDDGKLVAEKEINVLSLLEDESGIIANVDKEVYGLSEEVKLSGQITSSSAGKPGIIITVSEPDGDLLEFGTVVDQSLFSYTWITPFTEKTSLKPSNDRSTIASNYGVYKVSIATEDGQTVYLFYKVSPNPSEDSLNIGPLEISTDKAVYQVGETMTVFGSAEKRQQGSVGLVIPERAHIFVKGPTNKIIYDSSVYLDSGGQFQSSFKLPIGVFTEDTYKITVTYLSERTNTIFQVKNDIVTSSEEDIALLVDTDKKEYYPGDTIIVNGRTNKLVYLDSVEIAVLKEEQTKINCGSFVCGFPTATVTVRPGQSGTFTYEYKIQDSQESIGNYEVIADTDFDQVSILIKVIAKPEGITSPTKLIDKFNRIPDSSIPISVTQKIVDRELLSPRVIQGSLFSSIRGEESNVNLKITTEGGTCVIGQALECIVKDFTRTPGGIYQTIQLDDREFKVRYSGPDVMLEKFSILPASTDEIMPDSTWNVEVVKGDVPSRFYYKITYIQAQ